MALQQLDKGQQLLVECEKLRANQGAPSDPQMGERLWAAVKAKVKRLKELLSEKERYIKLQETVMSGLESQVKAPTSSSSAVAMSPQQTTGVMAQFAQPGAVTGVMSGQGGSTGLCGWL